MKAALFAALAVACVLAWVLARRRSDHRPIALLLSAGIVGDVALWAFDAAVIEPLRAELGVEVPWTGWARAAGHIVDTVWLAWPAAVVGAALVVFAGRSARPALAGWAVAFAAVVVAHPIAGDGSQGRILSAAQALEVAVSVGLGVAWFTQRAAAATPAQTVLAVIVVNEAISLLAASWAGPLARWGVMQVGAALVWCVVGLLQWRSLWAPKLSPSAR